MGGNGSLKVCEKRMNVKGVMGFRSWKRKLFGDDELRDGCDGECETFSEGNQVLLHVFEVLLFVCYATSRFMVIKRGRATSPWIV